MPLYFHERGGTMSERPVTELRRNRKKKSYAVKKKTLISVISLISVLSIILLLPVFAQTLLAYTSTLLSLCTLFLFGSVIVYLAIRLIIGVSDWMGSGKHVVASMQAPRQEAGERTPIIGSRSMKSPLWWDLGGVVIILIWAFILNLFHPFVTTLVWWQGYKLMGGKDFSLGTIEGTVTMVENFTYFGSFIFLLLLSQFYWRYSGRRNS